MVVLKQKRLEISTFGTNGETSTEIPSPKHDYG